MLNKTIQDSILDIVRQKPRTIQEIALTVQKNWRTADRYVGQIAEETGLIATRTFREGTRGALKVVYWNALERAKGSAYQERLLQKIMHGQRKEEFSAFDIYQFVDPAKRQAYLKTKEIPSHSPFQFEKMLAQAHEQILFFSGNLSWTALRPQVEKEMEELAKRKVHVKILARIDVTSQKYAEALLALNVRCGWDMIEIRHCEQPVRGMIVDDALLSLKEVLNPAYYRKKELAKKKFIFYLVKDAEWVAWLQKVFWHLWGQSIDAKERLNALESIEVMK